MLDKLNQIAAMVADAIASHPDSKKKGRKPDAEEQDESQEDAAPDQDKAAKVQKAIRKNMGGQKEPQY